MSKSIWVPVDGAENAFWSDNGKGDMVIIRPSTVAPKEWTVATLDLEHRGIKTYADAVKLGDRLLGRV